MFFFLGRAFFVALKNVSEKRVESMDGIGFSTYTTSTDNDGHESVSYYYKIDETRFMVHSSLAYHTLLNGHQYRVYYLPNSKVLVNIEVLEAPSAQHAI